MSLQSSIYRANRALNDFGQAVSRVGSTIFYGLGLVAFLCGATVPLITVYFFLNVDVVIQWWHIVLGVGGNIGIFIISMNMLRDLYVTPLIQRIESHQTRDDWDRSQVSQHQS